MSKAKNIIRGPANSNQDNITVVGARIHNLKNITVSIPKNKIIAITGVSGSGKSSLAFDIIFEEGRSRYLHAIGMPPRIEKEKPFDLITGLSPTIAVEQRTLRNSNPRSTIGTKTGLYNLLRMLYALEAIPNCPICAEPVNMNLECDICGMPVNRLEMKNYSFNEPSGMCLECSGRGYVREFRYDKIIPEQNFTLMEICLNATAGTFGYMKAWIPALSDHYGFDKMTPYNQLPKEIQDMFLYGSNGDRIKFVMKSKNYKHEGSRVYEGIIPGLERAMESSKSESRRRLIEQKYMDKVICPICHGFRINEQAQQVFLNHKHIGELAVFPLNDLGKFIEDLDINIFRSEEAWAIQKRLLTELSNFQKIGLGYLHLNRAIRTLSGGEQQRMSLLSQMSLGLENCILILDEPTMGMHEKEKIQLGEILEELSKSGNSIIIVEHDARLIQLADQIIDLGLGPGIKGGEVIFQGSLEQIKQDANSYTGKYLSHRLLYPIKKKNQRRTLSDTDFISLYNASTNNLKNVTVKIPLHGLIGICGVSGSGKSSLINDTLVPLLLQKLKLKKIATTPLKKNAKKKSEWDSDANYVEEFHEIHGKIEYSNNLVKCVVVDQKPIGRTRNSFPATYIGLWNQIRKLYSKQPLSKQRKYKDGHFSFNSDNGRCPKCKGQGKISLNISFLDQIAINCEECDGKRYKPEILEIKYHDYSIRDILDLDVETAYRIFQDIPRIARYLKILIDIGMGYITLGQSSTTLSGGEAQRIKLAKALGDIKDQHTLFILDEPTTGLHFHDEVKLLNLLDSLVDQGHSILVVEHNVHVLAFCDYLFELGPQSGPNGGKIIAKGIPETFLSNKNSIIKDYLPL